MKHFTRIALCLLSMFALCATSIQAQENMEDNDNYIPDTQDNGYESWLSGERRMTRSFEAAYKRSGSFKVVLEDKKTIYDANEVRVQGWPDYVPRFYVPSINKEIRKSDCFNATEIVDFEPTVFVTTKTLNAYTQPFDLKAFDSHIDIPAGEYEASRHAADLAEITYQGKKYWVNPQYNGGSYQTTYNGYYKDRREYLSVDKINGVPVHKKIMPIRESGRPGHRMKPKYVTIHNTANTAKGASAASHANLQMNSSNYTSWHFTADNKEIYQSIPMDEIGWHAGDGLLAGNGATIAIEICENADGNYAQAEKNAAYLAARILFDNGLESDDIRLHQDWSGKHCAHNLIDKTKGSMGWSAFKDLVRKEYDRIASEEGLINKINKTVPAGFEGTLEKAGLKFDAGMTTGYSIGSNVEDMKKKLVETTGNANIMIQQGNGKEARGKLATGQIVTMTNEKQETFMFAVVIRGDVDGDGQIRSIDYSIVKNDILNIRKLNGAFKKAGDIDSDGRIRSIDYSLIKNDILNIKKVQQ